jgi:hypothetical protein
MCVRKKNQTSNHKNIIVSTIYTYKKKSEIKTQIHNHEALKQKIEACKCKNKLKSGKSYNQIEVLA